MNSATQMKRHDPELAQADTSAPRSHQRRIWLAVCMVLLPLVAGLAWNRASDNPLWPVFRSSLNLCSLREMPNENAISPDGRYRLHTVQATCAARFPETMVFLSAADEPFPLRELNPNRAIVEVAGHRTIDALVWVAADQSPTNRMTLQVWILPNSQTQLHRADDHWRDVPIQMGNSKPAPGAEKLNY